jgi:hypothetical protein
MAKAGLLPLLLLSGQTPSITKKSPRLSNDKVLHVIREIQSQFPLVILEGIACNSLYVLVIVSHLSVKVV